MRARATESHIGRREKSGLGRRAGRVHHGVLHGAKGKEQWLEYERSMRQGKPERTISCTLVLT